MKRNSFPGQVVRNTSFDVVITFDRVETAVRFERFVRVKCGRAASATQADCDVLFITEDKALFDAVVGRMRRDGHTVK